jgi:TP901 family phage tail tape measure protein
MGSLPPVFIEFLGNSTGFMATSRGVRTELGRVEREGGGSMAKLGAVGKAALLGVGVAAAAAAVKTVHMAADFQTQMTRVHTGAGELAKNMDTVGRGVLAMAGQVGESTKDLTSGLYMVESAGFHGKNALDVLKVSAMGAKVGAADLATVTDAVTTAMNAYSLQSKDAATNLQNTTDVMNALVGTEAEGKTNMEALAGSMSKILPAAAAAHVGLHEVLGAMATMTMQGTSADVAATYLRQTIGQLSNPTGKASQAMRGLGLDATEVSKNLGKKGLASTLNMLTDAIAKHTSHGTVMISTLKKASKNTSEFQKALANLSPAQKTQIGALADMVGGTKSMMAALQLSGPHMQTFKDNVAGINKHVKDGGKGVEGWADVQKTFNQRMAQAKGSFEAIGISIGQVLLPYASRMIGWLSTGVTWLTKHKTATYALAGVIGGVLTVGLAAAAVAAWSFTAAMLADPVTWIVVGVMALVAALVVLIMHWRQVWGWIQKNIPAVAHAFVAIWHGSIKAWHQIWDWGVKAVHAVVKWFNDNVLTWLKARFKDLTTWWKSHSKEISEAWKLVWTLVKDQAAIVWDALKVGLSVLSTAWNVAWTTIKDLAITVWHLISNAVTTAMHLLMNTIGVILDIITGHWGKAWQDLKKLVTQAIGDVTHFLKTLAGDFGNLLYDSGKAIINGLINGIKSMAGAVGDAVSHVAHGAVSTFKSVLGIHSPSRVFHQLGVWIHEGLVNGLTSTYKRVQDAVKKTLKLLSEMHTKAATGVEKLVKRDGAALEKLAKNREKIAARLKSANAHLKDLQRAWTDEKNNVASGIMQNASVVMQGQNGAPISAGDVVANMQAQVAKAKAFAANLQQLKKMGLRADLIDQIAQAGVDQGGDTAFALAHGNAGQIAQLNQMQGSLVSTANTTGKAVADSMYGAGIKAAKGLVDGLKKQDAALRKQMEKIAESMADSIAHALGIKTHHAAKKHPAKKHPAAKHHPTAHHAAKKHHAAKPKPPQHHGPVHHHTTIHVEVHGSVRSDRDLRDVIQKEMLRLGGRNSTTWQQFKR